MEESLHGTRNRTQMQSETSIRTDFHRSSPQLTWSAQDHRPLSLLPWLASHYYCSLSHLRTPAWSAVSVSACCLTSAPMSVLQSVLAGYLVPRESALMPAKHCSSTFRTSTRVQSLGTVHTSRAQHRPRHRPRPRKATTTTCPLSTPRRRNWWHRMVASAPVPRMSRSSRASGALFRAVCSPVPWAAFFRARRV